MQVRIGLIGKTNTGKTTFFNAATLRSREISTYPFTTKSPDEGIAHVVTLCVHKEFGVQDEPRNSICREGWRFIPITLIDLPGLIKGAWAGKGLGNQFLGVAAQSDALIHVVDASGSVDAEGRITKPGVGDPVADIGDVEEELAMWYLKMVDANSDKISKLASRVGLARAVAQVLAGIGVKQQHVAQALKETGLLAKDFNTWPKDDLKRFCWALRDISKPTIIVANKMDLPTAEANLERIRDAYRDVMVVPASADAELTLRRAEQKGLIKYIPGEERFDIINPGQLTDRQRWALEFIRRAVFERYMRTGVQFALNVAVFKLLRMNTVYPVSEPRKLSDSHGRVLPDAFLMPPGASVRDLARAVHSELEKGLLYAIDVRTGLHLPVDYELKDRDVLSLVSATRKG
jgi:ribosome-binding ATPase YchF (GTP1/OBG family)